MFFMCATDIDCEIIFAQVAGVQGDENHEQGPAITVVHYTRNAEVGCFKRVHNSHYARVFIHDPTANLSERTRFKPGG